MAAQLSGRQLAIMQVLWKRGEATVADVQELLKLERRLAYSTVATVMSRMEKKGLIAHRTDGRTYLYRAAVSENGLGSSLVGDLVERIFGGSASELVSHLLESDHVDADELQQIKQLVKRQEAASRRTGRSRE